MNVTLDESIAIYARASLRWFGARAGQKTRERIEQLTQAGDSEGVSVHARVKEHIARMDNSPSGKTTAV
jgi:hypothetical protein